MDFCTVINCMDGRVQLPVNEYLQKRFNAKYVDSITETGPNLILSEQGNTELVNSILSKLNISIETHCSSKIAVVGHYDCAGNPAPKQQQIQQIIESVRFIQQRYEKLKVIGLWVDEHWEVHEI